MEKNVRISYKDIYIGEVRSFDAADLGLIMLLLIFVTPSYLEHFSFVLSIIRYLRLFLSMFLGIYLVALFAKRKKKYNLFINNGYLLLLIYIFTIFISTIINQSDAINDGINIIVQYIGISLLLYIYTSINFDKYISSINFYFSSLIFLNFITLLVFKDGLYQYDLHAGYRYSTISAYYFLGIDNSFGSFIFPTLIMLWVSCYIRNGKGKKLCWLISIVSLLTYIITFSVTGLVSIILLFVLIFFSNSRALKKLLNPKLLISAYIIATLLVVVFQIFTNNNLVSIFIQKIFGKSMTLSGRTMIWAGAISMIQKKPWFGYGSIEHGAYVQITNTYNEHQSYGAHNTFLQIILNSGLVGFIFIILAIITCFYYLKKYSLEKAYLYLGLTFFSLLMYYMLEAANLVPFLGMLSVFFGYISNLSIKDNI